MTLVDTATAAHAAGVAEATIRDWHRRNWLTRYGTKRKAEWDLEEVYRVTAYIARKAKIGLESRASTTLGLRR